MVYKNVPKFQSDMLDEYCDYLGTEKLVHIKVIMKSTRYSASTAIDYQNRMACFLYFDNGFSASSVETILTLPHSTVQNIHALYMVHNPIVLP